MPFRPSGGQLVLKFWGLVGSLPLLFKKGVYLLDLTALEHRSNGFKYGIWPQSWATSHMAFRAAVHLLAWFVRLRRRFGDVQGKVLEEVAARLGKEFGHGH